MAWVFAWLGTMIIARSVDTGNIGLFAFATSFSVHIRDFYCNDVDTRNIWMLKGNDVDRRNIPR
jgi:hypothetical protein